MNSPLREVFDTGGDFSLRNSQVSRAIQAARMYFTMAVIVGLISSALAAFGLAWAGPYYTAAAYIRFDFEADTQGAKDRRPQLQAGKVGTGKLIEGGALRTNLYASESRGAPRGQACSGVSATMKWESKGIVAC